MQAVPVGLHLLAIEAELAQQGVDLRRGMTGADFENVAGLPMAAGRDLQAQLKGRAGAAAGVQTVALQQLHRLVVRRLPIAERRMAGQAREQLLSLAQYGGIATIEVEAGLQGLRAQLLQALVETPAKGAEVLVAAVTQREYGVLKACQ